MPIEQTLDLCFKSFLLFLLRVYNFLSNNIQRGRIHSGRVYKAIQSEYIPDIYYFFNGSSIPYSSKEYLSTEEFADLEWEYNTVTKRYTYIKASVEDVEIRKFPFLCVDVKKGDEVDCVIGFFKDISWTQSLQPPSPGILLRTYGLENQTLISLEGLHFDITDANGRQHSVPIGTPEGNEAWARLFTAEAAADT